MPGQMDKERFRELAEAFGGDLARWPQSARPSAAAFAAARPAEARAILETAAALDQVLAHAPTQAPSPGLAARVLSAAPQRPERAPVWEGVLGWIAAPGPGGTVAARPALALLAVLSLSIAAGFAGGGAVASRDVAEALIAYPFAQPDTVFSLENAG